MPRKIDPGHEGRRRVLAALGLPMTVVGVVLTLMGVGSFFSSFGDMSAGPPRYFWMAFLGIPMLGVGLILLKFAYIGTIFRYFAGETAPVSKDVVNYMAAETQEGVETMARSVSRGVREGMSPDAGNVACRHCGAPNDPDARFCQSCGEEVTAKRTCGSCGAETGAEARFCDQCGNRL